MTKILFDEEGRFIGVKNDSADEEFKIRPRANLMTSKELTFLNKEAINDTILDSSHWSLYEDKNRLEPLKYSNGKTQQDVVKEVTDLIKKGKKVIFIHGVCGTGKSAIALNIARLIGRASIVVPFKNLQRQYEEDYTNKKYLLNSEGRKMKIAVITGRDNHDSIIMPGVSCADKFLPDNILITEKNRDKLIKYYNQNPLIKQKDISSIKLLKRISIAPSNPYWSPIRPAEYELNQLRDAKKKIYIGCDGRDYIFYHRREGCSYYDQFQAYLDADIIIFNAAKYNIEVAIGRKPGTQIDIIDEADAFLDNFSKEESINLTRLAFALQTIGSDYFDAQQSLEEINKLVNSEIKNKIALGIDESRFFALKDNPIGNILKLMLKSPALQAEIAMEENYANHVLEIAISFEDLFNEAYVTYNKNDENIYANIVTTNVEKRFFELCSKTNSLVLMSGTLHSKEIIEKVFGIKDFAIVEAETKYPGTIDIYEGGYEFNCDYKNYKNKRKEYLLALSSCVEKAKRPVLIHVNSYEDMPTETEIHEHFLTHLIPREKLRTLQTEDKNDIRVLDFKEKRANILFTTKCSRGADFPGDICNSIIYTKYPNPNLQEPYWKILKKIHSPYFWGIYKDKANREFLQRLYRALRHENDYVQVLSPDSRVIGALRNII